MTTIAMGRMTSTSGDAGRQLGACPAVDRLLRDCGCGQALDAWRTDHCPRCGVTLGRAAWIR